MIGEDRDKHQRKRSSKKGILNEKQVKKQLFFNKTRNK